MSYVLGIDLGTSAVKVLLMNNKGQLVDEASASYPLIQLRAGYNEQDPHAWVTQTTSAIRTIMDRFDGDATEIEGVSFSGQMHGLVLLNAQYEVVRPAILWNDTRNTKQCADILNEIGLEKMLEITKNTVLEGFTLPKILWVRENEPELYAQATTFVLPKDYVRFAMTDDIAMEYSDAAGTSLLDVAKQQWSTELIDAFDLQADFCPRLVAPTDCVGTISETFAKASGLSTSTKVFAGGADNACGALGAGIVEAGKTMVSIGTSGVLLSYEETADLDFEGKLHYFNHAAPDAYYTMGVTLSAGHSLEWFKQTFAKDLSFDELLKDVANIPVGSGGVLFTPYLVGERTPYADANIRASFIGLDTSHTLSHMARAVMEGITMSLNDSLALMRATGKQIDAIVSIGGGAKNADWLQMQADIFNAPIVRLEQEQGPGVGAAMIAAFGLGWFDSMVACSESFVKEAARIMPNAENAAKYAKLYDVYHQVYAQTKQLNDQLVTFRN